VLNSVDELCVRVWDTFYVGGRSEHELLPASSAVAEGDNTITRKCPAAISDSRHNSK
jgi:hypothetical protein